VIIILAVAAQLAVEGKTPPGWFIPFIVFASEWFIERPILHIKRRIK
ncbi:unnamed protein product, partial [marine sediment metagenome]